MTNLSACYCNIGWCCFTSDLKRHKYPLLGNDNFENKKDVFFKKADPDYIVRPVAFAQNRNLFAG